jgi:nucleoside 2-deoxyribosyltransferase
MPISTPESMLPIYNGDKDHFQHVLEHLFFPAIEKAGLKPVAPIAKGADVIHAEIIRNLETADLVLCDMSSLNANVFFELGIRTALAKPVCVLKDDATPRVPFDMTVVNYHAYLSALQPWTLSKEIDAIAEHITHSRERSQGTNMLWRYFSMSQRAELSISKDPTGERIELMMTQMEGLSKKIDFLERTSIIPPPVSSIPLCDLFVVKIHKGKREQVLQLLRKHVPAVSPRIFEAIEDDGIIRVLSSVPEDYVRRVQKSLTDAGAEVAVAYSR